MKENVLSFSTEFLLKFYQKNNQSNINKLRVLIDGAKIKINNKEKQYSEINNLMDPSIQNIIPENSVEKFYPKTDEQNLRYYLFWHLAGKTDSYLQKYGTAMTDADIDNFSKFYGKFCLNHSINFLNEIGNNNISNWKDKILKYLFTTKKLIIYDAYIMTSIDKIRSNLIPFLQNIQCNNNLNRFVFIITQKRDNINEHFRNCFREIKNNVPGIKLAIFAKSGDILYKDRFILTDYFNINANHSFEAIVNNHLNKKSELDFKSMLNKDELNSYQKKVETIRNLFNGFNFNQYKINETYPTYDEIHSDIKKEEIFKILDSF